MPRGRITKVKIHLSEADDATLQAWERSTTIFAGIARRGRLIQLLAQGWSVTAAAEAAGISRPKVYKWITRFQAEGLAGLEDHQGRWERPARHSAGAGTTEGDGA